MQTRARNVAVLLFDEVELLDVAAVIEVLSVAGRHYNFRAFKIITAGLATGLVQTRNQCRLHVDCTLADLARADVVVIPGGYGARRALSEPRIVDWIAQVAADAEVVLGIGYGSLLLAKAGLCRQAEVSVAPDVLDLYLELEPASSPSKHDFVASGKLFTAAGSGHSLELGLRVVERLLGLKFAERAAGHLGLTFPSPLLTARPPIQVLGSKD
jgi:transcriptional regulator GlxA family with amidase domain